MFLDILGLNPGDFQTQLGGDTSQSSNANNSASSLFPQYIKIDSKLMVLIEQHYKQETLIETANQLKSDHNLGVDGFEIRFAGSKVLEDDKYHHLEACNNLLEHARISKDMFGFVIVQDASTRLEDEVREITGVAIHDNDDKDYKKYTESTEPMANFANSTTLPIINQEAKLTAIASKYIYRASSALGLEDVRSTLLRNVSDFHNLQVKINTTVQGTTYPQNGPTLPDIVVGSYTDSPLGSKAQAKLNRQNRDVPAKQIFDDDDKESNDDDDETDEREVERIRAERLSKRANFDYLFTKIRHLKPVNFRDGEIYLRINHFTNDRDLVFCRRKRKSDGTYEFDNGDEEKARKEKKLPTNVIIDDTVKIYVWPNMMPSDEGVMCTKMYDTLMYKYNMQDANRRLKLADDSNVKPTVFLTYDAKITTGDMRELTESEMLNIAKNPTAREQKQDKMQHIGEFVSNIALDLMNGKRDDEFAKGLVNGVVGPTVQNKDGKLVYPQTVQSPNCYTVPLGRGYNTGAVVTGQTIDDPVRRKADYQEHIAGMVGIPLIQLLGGQGSSKKGNNQSTQDGSAAVTGGSAELSGGLFRTTITKDRKDLSACLQNLFEIFFRDMSNTELAKILAVTEREKKLVKKKHDVLMATLQEQFTLVTEAMSVTIETQKQDSLRMKNALITQFQRIADAAKQVTSLNHRFSVVFLRETFIENAEIDMLKSDGAISEFEAANMKRSKMGMKPISEHDFEKNRKKRLQNVHEEVDANEPTPPPDEGGPPKKRKT